MKANLIMYDVGSTYTKVSAFLMDKSGLTLLTRDQVPTRVDDIYCGISDADRTVEEAGHTLAADRITLATSSAAGGLRMVAMGYMPRVTAKAAKEVAMNAGARVLEIITHEDSAEYRIEILRETRPDIVLLAGGTDGGDRENLLENASLIVSSGIEATVILAGNIVVQPDAERILVEAGISCKRVINVMPTIHELKVEGARKAIHEEFIKQISFGKGLQSLIDATNDGVVIPTPGAVLMAAELIACGTFEQKGVGDLLVIDLGGATTDIHSIQPSLEELSLEEKGLVVTNEKQQAYRSVEGNLGMRISATGILETVGPKGILQRANHPEIQEQDIAHYVTFLEQNPGYIAEDEKERAMDLALASAAIEVALKRHAGFIAQEYNPVMGITPGTPIGRDLRSVKAVIAVGGVFSHNNRKECEQVVVSALENRGISLLPEVYTVYFDKSYLLYGIGLLAKKYPDRALQFIKQHLEIET